MGLWRAASCFAQRNVPPLVRRVMRLVAVGLFALVMTLASGAYIMMIGFTRQAQGTAIGIDNLSFALETMTRTIRTGTHYNGGVDCPSGCTSFSVINSNGMTIQYALSGGTITQNNIPLTDPSVTISPNGLLFYISGTTPGDAYQPHVTITVSGTVANGAGKPPQYFAVETGATMRSIDL